VLGVVDSGELHVPDDAVVLKVTTRGVSACNFTVQSCAALLVSSVAGDGDEVVSMGW
jgi:hypothetical protein